MTFAWEVTEDDVQQVLDAHDCKNDSESVLESLDHDEVEKSVLAYTGFEDQCNAASASIEEQLMELGIIEGERQCKMPQ